MDEQPFRRGRWPLSSSVTCCDRRAAPPVLLFTSHSGDDIYEVALTVPGVPVRALSVVVAHKEELRGLLRGGRGVAEGAGEEESECGKGDELWFTNAHVSSSDLYRARFLAGTITDARRAEPQVVPDVLDHPYGLAWGRLPPPRLPARCRECRGCRFVTCSSCCGERRMGEPALFLTNQDGPFTLVMTPFVRTGRDIVPFWSAPGAPDEPHAKNHTSPRGALFLPQWCAADQTPGAGYVLVAQPKLDRIAVVSVITQTLVSTIELSALPFAAREPIGLAFDPCAQTLFFSTEGKTEEDKPDPVVVLRRVSDLAFDYEGARTLRWEDHNHPAGLALGFGTSGDTGERRARLLFVAYQDPPSVAAFHWDRAPHARPLAIAEAGRNLPDNVLPEELLFWD